MVLEETLAHYRHTVEQDFATIERARRNLLQHDADVALTLPDVDLMERLRREELCRHVTVLRPAADAAWEALKREAHRRRPADIAWDDTKKGAGARDALIWLTVLETVQPGSESVLLVTSDGDFGRNGQLHPELQDELQQAGVDNDRVQLSPNVTDVLSRLADKAEVPEDLDEVLNTGQAADAVGEALQDNAAPRLYWRFRNQLRGPRP